MNYLGDFVDDATVYITFNTFDSNDPSASVTITNLAQADVEIWKNGVVQTTPGSGVTLTLNIGANNGSHLIAVDTSNTTDAGWFATGNDYQVRINGTTVDGATINAWVGSFSIQNRFMRGTDSALLAASVTIADGAIKSDLTHIHGTALTETAGQLAAAFKKLFDVATPTLVASDVMVGTDGANTTVPDAAGTAAVPGDAMNLAADAIKAVSYDERTAFPLKANDTAATQIARVGADGDTLETLSDEIAAVKAETVLIVEDTNAIQGKLPTNKFMGSSDGADDDGTLNTIATDAARLTAARAGALTDWINGGRLDLLLDAIKVITDALTAAGAAKLALGATTMITGTVSWDNTNATTTVIYSDDITEATADHFNGRLFVPTSGALLGQYTDITDYSLDTGEGKFTVTALTSAPADNTTFMIL